MLFPPRLPNLSTSPRSIQQQQLFINQQYLLSQQDLQSRVQSRHGGVGVSSQQQQHFRTPSRRSPILEAEHLDELTFPLELDDHQTNFKNYEEDEIIFGDYNDKAAPSGNSGVGNELLLLTRQQQLLDQLAMQQQQIQSLSESLYGLSVSQQRRGSQTGSLNVGSYGGLSLNVNPGSLNVGSYGLHGPLNSLNPGSIPMGSYGLQNSVNGSYGVATTLGISPPVVNFGSYQSDKDQQTQAYKRRDSNQPQQFGISMAQKQIGTVEEVQDGCPLLKVPRVLFRGVDGVMSIPHRLWKKGGVEIVDSRHFTVMSYNVQKDLEIEGDTQIESWESRREKILDEIAYYTPDFVCLQELYPQDFKQHFLPELLRLGYDGHYQQQKRPPIPSKDMNEPHGCAIFYMEPRFQLLAVQAFIYAEQEHDESKIPATLFSANATTTAANPLNEPQAPIISKEPPPQNEVAIICVFQTRNSQKPLRVRIVNTQFYKYENPSGEKIKLVQAMKLMEWLEKRDKDTPTVIAGDLRAKSGDYVLDYLVRGRVLYGRVSTNGPASIPTSTAQGQTTTSGNTTTVLQAGTSVGSGADVGSPVQFQKKIYSGYGSSPRSFESNQPVYLVSQQQQNQYFLRNGTKLASAYDKRDLAYTFKPSETSGKVADHILYTSGTISIRDVLGELKLTDLDKALNEMERIEREEKLAQEQGESAPGGLLDGIIAEEGEKLQADEEPHKRFVDTPDTSPEFESLKLKRNSAPVIGGDPTTFSYLSRNQQQQQTQQPFGTPIEKSAPVPYVNPNPTHFSRLKKLPTKEIPSTHIPLIAVLKWKTVPVLSPGNGGGRFGSYSGGHGYSNSVGSVSGFSGSSMFNNGGSSLGGNGGPMGTSWRRMSHGDENLTVGSGNGGSSVVGSVGSNYPRVTASMNRNSSVLSSSLANLPR
ncbi:hypothetical protein HK098_005806 [Nowakowskiella sp. JEL0407]|nr:hypothetical protein HK098_005806 [Nowakowskiella sp. JEL0407]